MKPFRDWVQGFDYVLPLEHYQITDWFRMPARLSHMGTDFCGKVGDQVRAMIPCVVTGIHAAGSDRPGGPPVGVTIETVNEDETTVFSYSHLDSTTLKVKQGDTLSMGQVMGTLVAQARPHCHLQMRAWVDCEIMGFDFPKQA
jgi:murein DD-endopeptidase MepM/ murein hydrolase activator NlpD